MAQHQELLDALVNLQKQIHSHHKMNVKKDFSLMVADAQASKAIANARAADQAESAQEPELPMPALAPISNRTAASAVLSA